MKNFEMYISVLFDFYFLCCPSNKLPETPIELRMCQVCMVCYLFMLTFCYPLLITINCSSVFQLAPTLHISGTVFMLTWGLRAAAVLQRSEDMVKKSCYKCIWLVIQLILAPGLLFQIGIVLYLGGSVNQTQSRLKSRAIGDSTQFLEIWTGHSFLLLFLLL